MIGKRVFCRIHDMSIHGHCAKEDATETNREDSSGMRNGVSRLSPDSLPKHASKSPHSEQHGATHMLNPSSRQIVR